MGNVAVLPVWKKGATAEERFLELARMAAEHPERFGKFVILYEEMNDTKDATIVRQAFSEGCDTTYALGLIEMGKFNLHCRTAGL